MQFNSGVKTISVTEKSRKIFEELSKIIPSGMSFSSFLAHISEEYLKGNINYTESSIPNMLDDNTVWHSFINTCNDSELKMIQMKLTKLQNIIDNRVRSQIC